MWRKILRRGSVGGGLTLLGRFGLRLLVALRFAPGVELLLIGGVLFVRAIVGVRVFVVIFKMMFVTIFLRVEVLMRSFVHDVVSNIVNRVTVPQGLARQHVDRRSGRRKRGRLRFGMSMTVIVVFEVFENVADIEERVAIEPDVDESRLHAGKHPRDTALVDTADEGELFFAFDINFD